jgi:hypothetical protein
MSDYNGLFLLFQMVGATRGTPEGFRPDQASGSQQLPPPPPNLAEVMAQQTELLNQLVRAQLGHIHHQSRSREEYASAGYQDFFGTQPPLFHKTEEPLDADAWLRSTTTPWYCPYMVGPLFRDATRWSCGILGRVQSRIPRPSHSRRLD